MKKYLLLLSLTLCCCLASSCGTNNTPEGSDTKLSCPGLTPGYLTVTLNAVLKSTTNNYRVELPSGLAVDKCHNQNDFSVTRTFRNLNIAIVYNDVSQLPDSLSLKVFDLGDCANANDDQSIFSMNDHPVIWQAEHIIDPACQIDQYIYRSNI